MIEHGADECRFEQPQPVKAGDALPEKIQGRESQMLDAWSDDHLTAEQILWKSEEHKLVWDLTTATNCGAIFDIGCGDGRILKDRPSKLAPSFTYIGFDRDEASVIKCRQDYSGEDKIAAFASWFPEPGDFVDRISMARELHQEGVLSICIGNTLGTWEGERTEAVRSMLEHSDKVLLSVCKNTPEITEMREEYYKKNAIDYRVDRDTGSIFSDTWGESRSFTAEQLISMVEDAGAAELGFNRISIKDVPPLGIAIVCEKEVQKRSKA